MEPDMYDAVLEFNAGHGAGYKEGKKEAQAQADLGPGARVFQGNPLDHFPNARVIQG
jgi:hypothetical protein